ncbi:hypothetical protein BU25DRAFT_204696 [Macroventuria anomochaeta]|uniref:Uncharacterized protein n=1 Tax=Macroventuria anomochaeta TaxID=301207 RepID=A0ACB6RL25_9PLEO|nr:uncharacterized protein BU25DRAFT_204696 [Macroventuria anomochaeta]KAF2622716.1 hypothetical protein BU25DRAFT_204696 [Macroventuria anomochaeta]
MQLKMIAALHYTCRQIQSETRFMHFALNTFSSHLYDFLPLTELIRCSAHEHMKEVRLHMTGYQFDLWMKPIMGTTVFQDIGDTLRVLKSLKKLERITILLFDDVTDEDREQQALIKAKHEFEQDRITSQDVKIVVERALDDDVN